MNCSNNNCDNELEINLSDLECESNGSSGTHTSSYTYEGSITCPKCGEENEVVIDTDEDNDTGEILSQDIR